MEYIHKPVMLEECINGLNIKKNGIYVDGTLGLGGHSKHILSFLDNGKLICIDKDKNAIFYANEKLSKFNNKILIHGEHNNIINILKEKNIDKVDGILLDLGVSSYQLDDESRGFSYMKEYKLDMRMNQDDKLTAYDVVNKYSKEKLIKIFFEYGEEKHSKIIAEKIIEYRKKKCIDTTLELANIIKDTITSYNGHPAKKVFQAIRIEVNGELINLKNTLVDCVNCLNKNGRLCVITFHSLEDKIVKHTFNELSVKCTCPKNFPVCICNNIPKGHVVNKSAIVASEDELKNNSRSKSAKLRIFEKG
ncbi:MAG: 16S rRNA (cytosine(1402)-N(4))-methyltransferase RsmH [Clostridia bacterium]